VFTKMEPSFQFGLHSESFGAAVSAYSPDLSVRLNRRTSESGPPGSLLVVADNQAARSLTAAVLLSRMLSTSSRGLMPVPQQPPNVKLTATNDYRESYSNSVQVRVSVWDFFLAFGTLRAQNPQEVEIANFQGIYLSPQQAKALLMILQQNVSQYESAFGEIKLDPQFAQQQGPVN
jgi:hypothetical protein